MTTNERFEKARIEAEEIAAQRQYIVDDFVKRHLKFSLSDEEIAELEKRMGKDYSYTTFKEARDMIIEDAIALGLIK
jgi:hypothetical protein